MMNSVPTYNSNIVNFKVNPYYSNLFMKNNQKEEKTNEIKR